MDEDLARSIGDRVRLHRTAARRTKAVVAGLAGITPDYLYQIERGQKVPTIPVLTRLAEVLGVAAGTLLDERSPSPRSRCRTGEAIYRALTTSVDVEPLDLLVLRRRVQAAWTAWQSSHTGTAR